MLLSEMREDKVGPQRHPYYNVGISTCEKGESWQRALALQSGMREAKSKPNAIASDNAVVSAYERAGQRREALLLLRENGK